MTLVDEFEDLLEEDKNCNSEKDTALYIKQYKEFCNSEVYTFSGVHRDSIKQCISIESTQYIPWEHINLILDVSILRDISKPRITEFKVPEFVEEIQCIGDKNHSGFGFNEYGRNHLKSIMISSSVFAIANEAFKLYRKLENIAIQDCSRLTIIGDEAFAYCENLKEIDLSKCDKLRTIGESIFAESNVKVLKINSKTRNFNRNTFIKSNLKSIYVDDTKYSFKYFIDMLENNNFEAFWI